MYDLNNPSPFVLTHFERIATVSSLWAVALALALDLWRARVRDFRRVRVRRRRAGGDDR